MEKAKYWKTSSKTKIASLKVWAYSCAKAKKIVVADLTEL